MDLFCVQVCEVFNFHRESYYLAVDYIDRYLACTDDVPKQQLQLIGEYNDLECCYYYYCYCYY